MAVKINKKLINYNQTAKKRTKSDIKHIVVHYVGALGDAKANVEYYGGGNRGASADFFVGHSGDIWQSVDYYNYYSWHCGGGLQGSSGHTFYGICTNANSVGIEMCVKKRSTKTMNATDQDWYFTDATIENTAQLVAHLMTELNISIGNVIRHYDVTGKICPNPFVYNTGSVSWVGFKKKVQEYCNSAGKRQINSDMTYTVQKGDTLTAIAKDFTAQGSKVTVKYLKKWNKLTSDAINTGQKLKLYYGKLKVIKKVHIRNGAYATKKSLGTVKKGTVLYHYGSKKNTRGNKWYKVWYIEKGVPKMRYAYAKKCKKV